MSHSSRSLLASIFSIFWICKVDFNVNAESRILTITAKTYVNELYVDGTRVTNLINDARWYLSDDVNLSSDNRLISILATDASSTCGGILASVTGDYLVTDARWKCSTENPPGWYALGFNDSSWSDAYVIGKNGDVTTPSTCNILTEIPSISSNASWIWTASIANAPVYDPIIYCRGYLPVCELDSPCQNGGECNRNDLELCTCPSGFSGTYCEIVADGGRILTITAKSYINELYVDGSRIRNLINEDRWYLSDDVYLTSDNRLISIFATDASGTCGGILASVTGDYLVTDASWKCSTQSPPGWYALGFDDSSWSDAYVIGKNGDVTTPSACSILTEISSISSNASWIWTASMADAPVYDPIIYCRGYLPVCNLDSPCQNGGECNRNAPVLCTCPSGFSGTYCEIDESRILTITAKSYITELYVDGTRIRNLINDARWYLSDDVDLTFDNRLISILATDVSNTCGGILSSVTGDYLVTDASWKCSTESPPGWSALGFNDSSWSDAYVIGKNGNVTTPSECNILTHIPSISSNASWIWTASIANAPAYDPIIYCRGYLPVCDLDSPCQNGGTCNRNAPELCTCPLGFLGKFCENEIPIRYLNITSHDSLSEVYVDGVSVPLLHRNEKDVVDSILLSLDSRLVAVMAVSSTDNCSAFIASVTDDYLVSNSTWKCSSYGASGWQYLGFDDSSWTSASIVGGNGLNPSCPDLGSISQISGNAFWIWSRAASEARGAVFCRGYLPLCTDGSPCENGGTCLDNDELVCLCTAEWAGKYCKTAFTVCLSEPCQNSGSCSVIDDGYACQCTDDYHGINCEKANNRSLLITANSTLQGVYVDELERPLLNQNRWDVPDNLPLTHGNRLIGVLAVDSANTCGGILASVTNDLLVTDSSWKCSTNIPTDWFLFTFDDSSWEPAKVIGFNGNVTSTAECSWSTEVTPISKSASWIWMNSTNPEGMIACRAYISICELENPCRNGATCQLKNSLLCFCLPEYTGVYCEAPINRTLAATVKAELVELYVDGINLTLINGADVTKPDEFYLHPFNRLVSLVALDTSVTCPGVLASVTGDYFVTDASWKCNIEGPPSWYALGFDDSSWEAAYAIGNNGAVTSPAQCTALPYIPSISSNAKWIWTDSIVTDPVYDQNIFCRGYFPVCNMDTACWNGGTCNRNHVTLCNCLPGFTGKNCEIDETKNLKITGEGKIYAAYVDGIELTLKNGASSSLVDTFAVGSLTRLVAVMATQMVDECPGVLASITDGSGDYFLTGTEWKCSPSAPVGWWNFGFDDSTWSPAVTVKQNANSTGNSACPNLPPVSDITSSAQWIWTSNVQPFDMTVYCRGYPPACARAPCQNGGVCYSNSPQMCACQQGNFGIYCEQTAPLNDAALVGETVIMNCKRTNTNVTWWFTTPGSTTSSVIVSNCKVLPEYSGLYSVDTTDYACNLVILNVQLSHGGTYACQEMSLTDVRTSAQLIILNGVQQCWSSLSSVVYGQTVTITCQVSFSENWAPVIQWTDVYGQAVTNATTDTTSSSITSYIVVPAFFPNVPSFTTTVFFSESSLPDVTDNIEADNTPTDVYNVATPVIDVVCPSGFTKTSQYHCYWLVSGWLDWYQSQSRCQQLYPGAYLVVISDASEQTDINNYLASLGPLKYVWTSGFSTTGGCWNHAWQPLPGGDILPMYYTNWAPGQPDCQTNNENRVEMFTPGYQWNDVPHTHWNDCLCEFELTLK